jgi:hypothetical protein
VIAIEVDEICRKLKPVLGGQIDRLWSLYQAEKPEGRKWIHVTLLKLLQQHLGQTYEDKKLLLPPPPEELCACDYELGRVCYGENAADLPFGLRESEWIQHAGLFGRSGSGKTNVGFLIILAVMEKRKPFLVFDWKRNYRDLLVLGLDILVFTAGRKICPFYFNPLIPPEGTSPKVWLKKLIEIIAHTYFLGEGVKYLLQQAFDQVYREFGIYEGKTDVYPTMADVLILLENLRPRGRQAEWMSSTLRAISTLCFGEFGEILNVRKPFPMEDLLKRNVILELDALTNSDKTFLIEALLLWLHHYRLAEGRREEFKHAIIIEEAHHILLRGKQEATGEEAVTDIILREIRELGEAVILIDQHPSLISKPALGNTYTTIAMNLKHKDDVLAASNAMLLGRGEQDYLGELEVGSAIVKLQGRWFRPFLVKFPLINVPKGSVTDEKLKEQMQGLFGSKKDFSHLPEPNRDDLIASKDKEGLFVPDGFSREGSMASSEKEKKENDEEEGAREALLGDIVRFPYSSTQERYGRLGWNFYKGNRIRDRMVRDGWIQVRTIKRPDGMVKVFGLTDKGMDEAGRTGLKVERTWRKGGLEHGYWVQEITSFLRRQGFAVQVEKGLGKGKSVDLEARRDGKRIALEVETGKSDAISNIRKALEAGYDRVLVVCLDGVLKEKVMEQVRGFEPAGKERLFIVGLKEMLHLDFSEGLTA